MCYRLLHVELPVCAVLTLICAQIAKELQQGWNEAEIEDIVQRLLHEGIKDEEWLLQDLQRWPDEQLLTYFMQSGFNFLLALSLGHAVKNIRSPTGAARGLSPYIDEYSTFKYAQCFFRFLNAAAK